LNTRFQSSRPRFLFSLALFLGLLAILRLASLSAIDIPAADGDSLEAGFATADDQSGDPAAKPSGSTTINSNEKSKTPSAIPTSTSSVTTVTTSGEGSTASKPLVSITRSTPATVNDLRTIQSAIQQAVEKALPATVGVSIAGTFGSGVIVTEDGYVLTAGHVVARPGRTATIIMPDGKHLTAKTLGMNANMDSGMLKITDEGKYPHVELGHSGDLKIGQWCITLGHPNGLQPNRPPVLRAGRILMMRDDVIETDCTIVGGDSGGPLLDTNGRVIGIHSRISDDVVDNYHVPIDTFRDTWDHLAAGDQWGELRPNSAVLGVNGKTDSKGCRLVRVFPDYPAFKAGLQVGDIIVGFGDDAVKSLDDLQVLLNKHKPGEEIALSVLKGDQKQEVKLKLARPE
jgi:serine protease Do